MSNNRITVWTPVFNGEKTLLRCIESIVGQSVKPFEYLILDDCSTDGSLDIAFKYAQDFPWIKVIQNDANRGAFANFNRILHLANGDYLYAVADDDFSTPITIERFSASIKRWPNAQLFSGKIQVIDSEENKVCVEKVSNWITTDFHNPSDCLTNYFLKEPAHHSLGAASLISTKSFKSLGGFNEDLGHWSDTFNLRYIAFDNGMVYIPEVLHYWTSNHNTLSGCERNNPKEFLKVIHNSAKLMRSDRYKLVFPEEFVQYWEDGCCHYIIDPILGSYEYLLMQRNLRFFNAIKDDNLNNKIIGFLFKYFLKVENILFTKIIRKKTQFLWKYISLLKKNK
jgi:glycosyltransferase involved in cell wall biosynthesis